MHNATYLEVACNRIYDTEVACNRIYDIAVACNRIYDIEVACNRIYDTEVAPLQGRKKVGASDLQKEASALLQLHIFFMLFFNRIYATEVAPLQGLALSGNLDPINADKLFVNFRPGNAFALLRCGGCCSIPTRWKWQGSQGRKRRKIR